MNTQVYQYNNNPVTFRAEHGFTYISATEMAKPFGKQPYEYLRLPSTNELVKAITGKSRIAENQLVIIERGGVNPGTWLLSYKHQNKGYTKTHTHTFMRSDGSTGSAMQTVWTEKGREFIHSIIDRKKS